MSKYKQILLNLLRSILFLGLYIISIIIILHVILPEPPIPDHHNYNCILTEKGYCAKECYENNKLMPCQYFTSDEHFCNEGICEVSGICPTYFEELDGKTIGDCINEVVESQGGGLER